MFKFCHACGKETRWEEDELDGENRCGDCGTDEDTNEANIEWDLDHAEEAKRDTPDCGAFLNWCAANNY